MTKSSTSIPKWFWFIASLALMWNMMGGWAFFYEIRITPEAIAKLPINQQVFYENKPIWSDMLFALSVLTGIIGSSLLNFRKKIVVQIFTFSLVSIVCHDIYAFLIRGFYKVALPYQYIMPLMVIVIAGFLVWFSRFSHKKGWLH